MSFIHCWKIFTPQHRHSPFGSALLLFTLAACFSLPAAAQGDTAQSGQEAAQAEQKAAPDAHEDATSSTAQGAAEAASQDLETLAQADTAQTTPPPPPPPRRS